jgi:hypothetical protein
MLDTRQPLWVLINIRFIRNLVCCGGWPGAPIMNYDRDVNLRRAQLTLRFGGAVWHVAQLRPVSADVPTH